MAGSSFEESVRSVLSDTMNLPQDFLNYAIQYQAQNALSIAKTSGTRLAYDTNTSSVSTAGTTFGTGADLLSSALEFTATGSNSYILRVHACDWFNTGANRNQLNLNLDGSDAGLFCSDQIALASNGQALSPAAFFTPAAGEHSVNARLVVNAGTGTVEAGAGGAATRTPIIVTLEVA